MSSDAIFLGILGLCAGYVVYLRGRLAAELQRAAQLDGEAESLRVTNAGLQRDLGRITAACAPLLETLQQEETYLKQACARLDEAKGHLEKIRTSMPTVGRHRIDEDARSAPDLKQEKR